MKLIECHVNNFGKLSDFSYNFSEGLNVINEENGFGKSTFAAFIKSMLYGLEDTKRPSLSENDRKKYEPWQGGAWGGSLTLSSDGKTYRIERSFSKKASLDEVKIYDTETGRLTDKFSEKSPGESMLGIDREGFERTVFLSERDIDEKKVNNSVSAKLSRLTGVAFDMAELDSANKILDEERKYYQKHGGSGAISDVTKKISELEFKKAELLSLEKKHDSDAKAIAEKENEIRLLKDKVQKEAEDAKDNALKKERYAEYKRKLSEKADYDLRTEKILEFFGGKMPEKETLFSFNSLKDELLKLDKDKSNLESELNSYPEVPRENEISDALFLSLKIKENQEKVQILEAKKSDTGALKAKKIKIFAILGAAFSALGAGLAFLSLPLLLIALPGIFLLAAAFITAKKENSSAMENELDKVTEENAESQEKLSSFLAEFGYSAERFEFAISEFRRITKEKELLSAYLKSKAERIAEIHEKCNEIISVFPIIDEYPAIELATKIDNYIYLSSNSERLQKECLELSQKFDFSEIDRNPSESVENFSEALIQKERELSLLKNVFSLDETALEELDEINASIEGLKETEANFRYKYEIIKKTKIYLESAKDSLTAKYLGKTRDAFSKYAEAVSKSRENFGVDTSFAVTKTENGQTRTKESFSKGLQNLYNFALRLSFSDSLYEGELPFLMLDDPFAYFDDSKLASALSLISELSKTRQIIYFTAAKSRT